MCNGLSAQEIQILNGVLLLGVITIISAALITQFRIWKENASEDARMFAEGWTRSATGWWSPPDRTSERRKNSSPVLLTDQSSISTMSQVHHKVYGLKEWQK